MQRGCLSLSPSSAITFPYHPIHCLYLKLHKQFSGYDSIIYKVWFSREDRMPVCLLQWQFSHINKLIIFFKNVWISPWLNITRSFCFMYQSLYGSLFVVLFMHWHIIQHLTMKRCSSVIMHTPMLPFCDSHRHFQLTDGERVLRD